MHTSQPTSQAVPLFTFPILLLLRFGLFHALDVCRCLRMARLVLYDTQLALSELFVAGFFWRAHTPLHSFYSYILVFR